MHHSSRTLARTTACAECGAPIAAASQAIPYEDGLVCCSCDDAAMASAVDPVPVAIAAFCAAFDDTVTGELVS